MARQLPSLSALRAFEAAARSQSFSRAAAELFVTQGAVSRHIRTLEFYLGVSLFRRFNRRVELTELGAEYYASLSQSFENMEAATARLRVRKVQEILSVYVLPSFALRWLVPRLSSFAVECPEIEVRLTTSVRSIDWSKDDVDVAIRVGRSNSGLPSFNDRNSGHEALDITQLLNEMLVPCCAPSLLQQQSISDPADLNNCVLLHTSTRPDVWDCWCEAAGQSRLQSKKTLSFGHFFLTEQAALDGVGVAVIPRILIADHLAEGRLVALFGSGTETDAAFYLLHRKRQAREPKVQAFRGWLAAEAHKKPRLSESRSSRTATARDSVAR
jgi:LysR family glycine cleavage system transcriptional activator